MLTVTVYGLDDQGNDAIRGTLAYNGARVAADPPDSQTLRTILAAPCNAGMGRMFAADKHPEEFLRNLHRMYRGAYLRAGEAEEGQ